MKMACGVSFFTGLALIIIGGTFLDWQAFAGGSLMLGAGLIGFVKEIMD